MKIEEQGDLVIVSRRSDVDLSNFYFIAECHIENEEIVEIEKRQAFGTERAFKEFIEFYASREYPDSSFHWNDLVYESENSDGETIKIKYKKGALEDISTDFLVFHKNRQRKR